MNTYDLATEPQELPEGQHIILAENLDRLAHKVEVANRKAARNELDGRFEVTVVETYTYKLNDGTAIKKMIVNIGTPELVVNGHEFIGTVTVEEGGTILRMVPGVETPEGYVRPDSHNCDHCGVRRDRTRSYLVKNTETGEISQIGSTCLELYFGLKIKGLWVLGALTAEEIATEFAQEEGGGRTERLLPVRKLIALAWAITSGGKGFVSRASSDPEAGRIATSDEVLDTLFFVPGRDRELNALMEERNRKAGEVADADIDSVLEFAETLSDSDYAQNAQAAARSTYITYRSVGVLVSLVGVRYRSVEREAAAKAERAERNQEFVGTVKERLRGLELTITSVRYIEGAYGTTTLLVMTDAAGHTFKWFASAELDFEAGQVMILDATVKAHDTYQGNNETLLTRGKVHEVAASF